MSTATNIADQYHAALRSNDRDALDQVIQAHRAAIAHYSAKGDYAQVGDLLALGYMADAALAQRNYGPGAVAYYKVPLA